MGREPFQFPQAVAAALDIQDVAVGQQAVKDGGGQGLDAAALDAGLEVEVGQSLACGQAGLPQRRADRSFFPEPVLGLEQVIQETVGRGAALIRSS